MKVHDVKQGDVDWMLLRSGIPTASEFDYLVSPMFKVREGEMPRTYLAKKTAEWWQGGPLMGFSGFDLDQGQLLEQEAIPWFELQYDTTLLRPGFISTDDGLCGCSPDGMLNDNCGIEIKCPRVETHTGYLLAGVLPKDYAAQVHGSMFVTGASQWKFLSYCRHFPPLLITVERDEEIQAAIGFALTEFNERFTAAKAKMEEINGGPPRRTITTYTPKPKPQAQPELKITYLQ